MIRFASVNKTYSGSHAEEIRAVVELNLEVSAGETHCLIGTSGCGKTTTMRMVNRLVEPTSGTVLLAGEDVATLDVIRLRRGIGYVIQSGGLFPHMTVAENIGLLCRLEGWDSGRTQHRIDELLAMVNLSPTEFGHRHPGELSGGQRQRVGIARALVLDPPCLLMDEPFGALDPITRGHMHNEFQQLQQAMAKTIILVTHDIGEAFRLGDRISVMHHGRILQTGTEQELRTAPADALVSEFTTCHTT